MQVEITSRSVGKFALWVVVSLAWVVIMLFAVTSFSPESSQQRMFLYILFIAALDTWYFLIIAFAAYCWGLWRGACNGEKGHVVALRLLALVIPIYLALVFLFGFLRM